MVGGRVLNVHLTKEEAMYKLVQDWGEKEKKEKK
jgi:hypothetical protein